MDLTNDKYLDICQSIEAALRDEYELHPRLTDAVCIFALDGAKIAIKQHFGFAKNEKVTGHPLALGIIEHCKTIGMANIGAPSGPSLSEFVARVEEIKRSVRRHSTFGERGYYEFIKRYV